ncbi:MAG TPA: aldo/keto reductase [Marmoricola sp.]|nr:aldo/keto reductase [Marmoricola sp.]
MTSGAAIGVGLAAVGRPAYINAGRDRDLGESRSVDALRARTWAVLDAAYEAGVRYVDVARSYGRAEEFLAQWLDARPEVDVEVGSKWGYRYVGDWRMDASVHEVKDHSLAAFLEQWKQTEALLGGRISVYHVHSATLDTGVLKDAELHRALAELRERGVTVGISTSGAQQADAVREALAVTVDGRPLFTSFQSTWNVLETSVAPALAEARAAGARVIVKEGMANGRLAPGAVGERESRFQQIAARLGVAPDALALACALAQPWATCVLSGAATAEQVRSNAAARDVEAPADVLEELAALAEAPADYWAARSGRAWA